MIQKWLHYYTKNDIFTWNRIGIHFQMHLKLITFSESAVITQKWDFLIKSDWNTLSDAFKTNYVFRISSSRLQFISSYLFLLNSWIDTQIVVLLHKNDIFTWNRIGIHFQMHLKLITFSESAVIGYNLFQVIYFY